MVYRNKISLFLLMFFCIVSSSNSQDGVPIYSDYFADNLYLLHPSMAGAANSGQIRLTARKQWFEAANAPSLQTLAANMRVGERSGIGAIFFNDKNGFHSQIGGYLTYAHHINFSRSEFELNQISFGLTAGVVQNRLDETNFDATFDPVIQGILLSTSYYNIDVGASYNFLDLSVHLTVKNLVFQNRDLYSQQYESANQRRYLLAGAYTISGGLGSNWSYEPSFLVQLYERTQEAAFDINFKAFHRMDFGNLWGGVSYRRSFDGAEFLSGNNISTQKLQLVSPVIGVNINDFMFAYTYSHNIGNIKFSNSGYHQITLGYNFLRGRERFDCLCPAVN